MLQIEEVWRPAQWVVDIGGFKEEFALIGSRVFLHGSRNKWYVTFDEIPEGTDWDYAAQHREDLPAYLTDTGWENISARMDYPDSDTVTVWEKFYGKEKVQLSLRKDLKRYLTVWYSISRDVYKALLHKEHGALDKQGKADYFDSLYYIYDQGVSLRFEVEDLL